MKVINQKVEHIFGPSNEQAMEILEAAARTCYKSEWANAEKSKDKRLALIRRIVQSGHHSVLEHINVTFRVTTNRGISHEIVRHRVGVAYSQESTRYCNYSGGLTLIRPHWVTETEMMIALHDNGIGGNVEVSSWLDLMETIECCYQNLLDNDLTAANLKPEDVRGVLPTDLKTEIVMTANIRALRHIIKTRRAPQCHPQVIEVANLLLALYGNMFPVLFEDMKEGG